MMTSLWTSSGLEVIPLDLVVSFILSVLASVVGYYICKWLGGEK